MSKLPYTYSDAVLNSKIETLMNDFDDLVTKAKNLGLDIKLWPDAKSLVLYFNDDYPNTLLVDKSLSSENEVTGNLVISTMGGTEAEWIITSIGNDIHSLYPAFKCSKCGEVSILAKHAYCPGCGARMQGAPNGVAKFAKAFLTRNDKITPADLPKEVSNERNSI